MTSTAHTMPVPGTNLSRIGGFRLIALSLGPGLISLLGFIAAAAVYRSFGLPNIFALYTAILLVEVPLLTFLIVYLTGCEHGRFSLKDAFPWHASLPWWQYVVIGIPLIIVSVIMQSVVGPPIQEFFRRALFLWVPTWLRLDFSPERLQALPHQALLALWALGFVSAATLGGLLQEVYFRGYLLPRMAWMGRWVPVVNAALFAMYHMASPWAWPGFFLMILFWSAAVYWKRSIFIGIVGHSGMLLLGWLGLTALVFLGGG